MLIKKRLLLATKRLNQIRTLNTPTTQRITGRFVLPNQLSIRIKTDPMPVKQLVDMGREKQPIGTIEPLMIITITPRLDMAGNEDRNRPVKSTIGSEKYEDIIT